MTDQTRLVSHRGEASNAELTGVSENRFVHDSGGRFPAFIAKSA